MSFDAYSIKYRVAMEQIIYLYPARFSRESHTFTLEGPVGHHIS